MVYSGKIYETDGANAIAMHEADAVRPLSPIPHAPSLRIFRTDPSGQERSEPEPAFFYGNPGCLVGASQIVNPPEIDSTLEILPMVAAVIVTEAFRVDIEDADDLILGFTLVQMLVAQHEEFRERALGFLGRSHDLGGVIGPVLTTPDELEEEIHSAEFGRKYGLTSILRVNGVERERGTTLSMPYTFAQAISYASQTCTLKTGDIFAFGPIVSPSEEPTTVGPGDDVQLAIEKLGALSLKINFSQ